MKRLILVLVSVVMSSCAYYDDGRTKVFDILPTTPTYYQPYPYFNQPYGYVPACFSTYPQPHWQMRSGW